MSKKKVLITGVNGFIGRRLVDRLSCDQFEIYGLDLSSHAFNREKFTRFFVQDIQKTFHIKENFDAIIHLAALNLTHVNKADKAAYRKVNCDGVGNLIEATQSEHLIFMSTTKLYHEMKGKVNERHPVKPLQDYEQSKLTAEGIIKDRYRGKFTIFRCSNVVGPGQGLKAVVPVFIKNAVEGKPIDVFAPRGTILQLLYVDDLIDVFVKAVNAGGRNEIYNLAGGEVVVLEQLVERIVHLTSSRSEIKYSNPGKVPRHEIDISKARRDFGWEPRFSVYEMLQQCAAYHKK